MTNPKEQVYDEQINPLMAQIIEICKQHKIALLANFNFCQAGCACHDGEGCACTTRLLADEFDPSPGQLRADKALFQRADFAAFTLTTRPIDRRPEE